MPCPCLVAGSFHAVTYTGLNAAGAVFSLANPIAGLVVFGMAVGGSYLSGRMTADNNKARAFEEWDVKVVKPKLYVMRMLHYYEALTPAQKAEYDQIKAKAKRLEDREALYAKDLDQAKSNIEGLSRDKQKLETERQRLEVTSREQSEIIRSQDERKLELEETERRLRNSLGQRETDLANHRTQAEELLVKTRAELERQHESTVEGLKTKHKKEQDRLQAALDAEKNFRRKANYKFLLDKQHDIKILKDQRNFLASRLAKNNGTITASLDLRIQEMEEKLRNFLGKFEQDGASSLASLPVPPDYSATATPIPFVKEDINEDLQLLREEIETLTEQLQEEDRKMLEAICVLAEKEMQLRVEVDQLGPLNLQLQKDIEENERLVMQLQQRGTEAESVRDEALQLLEEEKRKLLEAKKHFDEGAHALGEAVKELQHEKAQLVKEATLRDTELTKTKEKIEEVNRSMDTLRNNCDCRVERLKEGHAEALVLREKQVKRAAELEWQSREEKLKKQLHEVSEQVDELTHQAEVSQRAYEDLERKYAASAGDITKIRELVNTHLPGVTPTGHDVKAAVEQSLLQLKKEKEALEESVQTLSQSKESLQTTYDTLKDEQRQLLEGASDAGKELHQLREEFRNLGERLAQQTDQFEREVKEARRQHKEELEQSQLELETLQKQQESLALKDAALTVSYRLALQAKKSAEETIRQRDEELLRVKEEFSNAQNQWDLAKIGFEEKIRGASVAEVKLKKELEVLNAAGEQLKEEVRKKDEALKKFGTQMEEKDLVLEQDKTKLATLEHEKDEAKSAVKKIEVEINQFQLLYTKLQTSKEELGEAHTTLEEERNRLLLNLQTAGEGKKAVEKQLQELHEEFDEAKQQFDLDREKVELAHKQQIKEKEEEFAKLEQKLKRGTAFQKAKTTLSLLTLEKVRKSKSEALMQIERQKRQLEKQEREFEDLRRDKDRLEKKVERQRVAYLRQWGNAANPDEGDIRVVGDTGTRLKVNLFDFKNITDKSEEFEEVYISPNDMVGSAAKKELTGGLKAAQLKLRRTHEKTHGSYEPVRDGLPTLSKRRERMKTALEEYRQELLACKTEFARKKGEAKAHEAILKNLDETIAVAEAGIRKISSEEEKFKEDSVSAEELLTDVAEGMEGASVSVMGNKAYTAFLSAGHKSQEVRDLARARLVETLAEKFSETVPTTLPDPGDIDTLEKMRAELEEKKKILQQFHPDNLPLDTGKSVSSRGKQYLDHTVKTCTASLDHQCRTPKELEEVFPVEYRNEGGMVLARRMLANPGVCADVCSWFSSLQERHAGIKKTKDSFDYYTASVTGLEVIRHDHGLVYMPTSFELLTAIKADLGEVDSKFTTESCRQHRGTSKDSSGDWRRKKLIEQCDVFSRQRGRRK